MLQELSKLSETNIGVTRLPYTSQHRAVIEKLTEWMQEDGLEVSLDDAGTLIGRREGPINARTFYLGSHQDSVREGGAFDGIMGIVLPILALRKLQEIGTQLPYAVEILAFADEEGVRFPTALVGSRALAGTFDPIVLGMKDANGLSLKGAMEQFGLKPDNIHGLKREPSSALGYLETHIEQGPVLENTNEALGVVTAICGIERMNVVVTGETGHAGTLPMAGRKDALVVAAEIILEVNARCRNTAGLRGTVGAISIEPNVVNAVPREAKFPIELRSPSDETRQTAAAELHKYSTKLSLTSGVQISVEKTYAQDAQPCDGNLTSILENVIKAEGGRGVKLPSGATHDASAMADICPIAMLFVRCAGGISHTPQEFVSENDLASAISTICGFLVEADTHLPEKVSARLHSALTN